MEEKTLAHLYRRYPDGPTASVVRPGSFSARIQRLILISFNWSVHITRCYPPLWSQPVEKTRLVHWRSANYKRRRVKKLDARLFCDLLYMPINCSLLKEPYALALLNEHGTLD
jgi:hypothetical protein